MHQEMKGRAHAELPGSYCHIDLAKVDRTIMFQFSMCYDRGSIFYVGARAVAPSNKKVKHLNVKGQHTPDCMIGVR
jgi:hypothetical protein